MKNEFLHEPFVDALKDIYDAEQQLVKALPKVAKKADNPELKKAITAHLEETKNHVVRLEAVFKSIKEKPARKTCEATKGLIEEADEVIQEEESGPSTDALLILCGQKVEHYEIATYGTLKHWAEMMEHTEAAELLGETLEEEKAADEKLTEVELEEEEVEQGAKR